MAANPEAHEALYDTDFHAWVEQQVALLRAGDVLAIDVENVIEELESLAAKDRRELISRLIVLYLHLLKWQYQPARRSTSWRSSIREARTQIELVLDDSPSLRPRMEAFAAKAYLKARAQAADETGLAQIVFPAECPFELAQVMDSEWLPEGDGNN